jgi:hypothetical protein
MLRLISMMQIISNTCNIMLYSTPIMFFLIFLESRVLFILHIFHYVISNTTLFVIFKCRRSSKDVRRTSEVDELPVPGLAGRQQRRGRRRRKLTPPEEEAVEDEVLATPEAEAQADEGQEEPEQEDEPSAEANKGSAATGESTPYLRGPASLPARPIPRHQRPVIRPIGQRYMF